MTKSTECKHPYSIGDLLLVELPYLREVVVEDIFESGNAVKVDGSWVNASEFYETVRGKLGYVDTKKSIFGTIRTIVRTRD